MKDFILHSPDNSRSEASGHSAASPQRTIFLSDETATIAFAGKLAGAIKAGTVIYLHGDLGAGKTTLVRALLHALGHTGRVKSPTYTLLEQYEAGGLHLRHFDLYRFRDAEEWEAAGFRDEFDGCNICLIEWPEKAHGLIPEADMDISFEILPGGRNLAIKTNTPTGRKCLKALSN